MARQRKNKFRNMFIFLSIEAYIAELSKLGVTRVEHAINWFMIWKHH
ncbi:MAG: hypothetical protein ETSY2_02270 [Candidatus Entotheonella gemina]|uniref:Uncharacterized protein n=1 Tax=Candidatus Entotheonella gemina TaxID=1429439 RepID=W4MF37_9BACT|nr:MAG: hypothetical protein ETSY2_02270 [Candidatus Entotheonella gemina]